MDLREIFDAMPFAEHVGIEMTAAADGEAAGYIELGAEHSSTPDRVVAHGGVPYTLADSVGGAAVMSVAMKPTPTVDMRMDYLAPSNGDRIEAEAEVVRFGDSVAVADVTVTDGEGAQVAEARGVYKTGGGEGETAWGNADDA
ncbi:PaaI family thioesterase [Halosegnis marinus]|uniref:PaaI family thioesterase n=1 Tax=Halosegnis marinus TaxID=3034023 RepID=A0ABD5ZPW4_9EURY|nr:PaaI family thioesterase [Halosegnis sp. DT85]